MRLFGKPYTEVHKLLDQFAHGEKGEKDFPNWPFIEVHRRFLHHVEGVEYVRKRWGEQAAEAAMAHILMDCDGYLPLAVEYYVGVVDQFGSPKRGVLHDGARCKNKSCPGPHDVPDGYG